MRQPRRNNHFIWSTELFEPLKSVCFYKHVSTCFSLERRSNPSFLPLLPTSARSLNSSTGVVEQFGHPVCIENDQHVVDFRRVDSGTRTRLETQLGLIGS
jgi:hypothetical protein